MIGTDLDLPSLRAMLASFAIELFTALGIVLIGWLISRWLEARLTRYIERKSGLEYDYTPSLARLVRVVIMSLTVIAALGRMGVQTASITALVGAAGLAIGLALQGTLSNVAAGIMLMLLRPFKVGQGVDIAGTGGTVTEVGLFSTRLTTWDGVVVYIPNGTVWSSKIMNFSQAGRRRFDLMVGISYKDDVARALQVMREVVTADPRVLSNPAPLVATKELTDTSVNLMAQFWTAAADLLPTQFELTRKVKERFDEEGFTMPVRALDYTLRPPEGT
ncbi:MAG TPA: mechanosensitive ion channel domain-containing protein [Trueperaceae bacterium]|nr:mechanosensitive ion channel domain-containing protein [Trueperaceae bacterium]